MLPIRKPNCLRADDPKFCEIAQAASAQSAIDVAFGAANYASNCGKAVGLLLNHSYSASEHKAGTLKGSDYLLMAELDKLKKKAGVKLTTLPVVIHHHETYGEEASPENFWMQVGSLSRFQIASHSICLFLGVPLL